jgi:small-conductance mechanosensitive channel
MNNFPMMQDLSGIAPVYQNTSAQQQNMQQLMQQGGQLANQALQGPQSGMDAKMLAEALRKSNPNLSQQQNAEIRQLGSNPNNPFSGYNTGMFGWGNYGE